MQLALGGDRNGRDAKRGLASVDAPKQFFNRGFNEKFRSDVNLLGNFFPELDTETREPAIFFKDKGADLPSRDAQVFSFRLRQSGAGKEAEKKDEYGGFHIRYREDAWEIVGTG